MLMPALTDAFVRTAPKGEYTDGQTSGLILRIQRGKQGLRRSWVFRAPLEDGRRRRVGLGSYPDVSLAKAREKAKEARRLIADAQDPSRKGQARRRAAQLTVGRAIDLYFASVARAYKSQKSEAIRQRALRTLCAPLHDMPVEQVSSRQIASTLKDLAPETRRKTLAALRAVFDLAVVELEHRGVAIINPASADRMKAMGYVRPTTLSRHPALEHWQLPAFMAALAAIQTPAARCLEFVIATVARSGAARLARFDQIDVEARVWRVPAEQLKDGNHRSGVFVVPLSPLALAAVEAARSSSLYIFAEGGEPLRGDRLTTLMRSLRRKGGFRDPDTGKPVVIHGFRAAFRTWVETSRRHDRDVAELAMGHKAHGAVEARYVRDDLLDERRKLLEAWAHHCTGESGEVVPLRRA
jgi:integrase